MEQVSPAEPERSNRFARELEDILQARGKRLTDLYHAGIYREQVRRLRRSLREVGRFPLLSLAEIDRIILHYQLTEDEIVRLRAALVATAVERMLFSRQIPITAALQATDEVFVIVSRAMRDSQLADVRGDPDLDRRFPGQEQRPHQPLDPVAAHGLATDEDTDELDDSDISELLDDTLDQLDRATLALHLGVLSRSRRDRIHYLQAAVHDYQAALEVLAAAAADPTAALWSAPTRAGLNEAQAHLRTLRP